MNPLSKTGRWVILGVAGAGLLGLGARAIKPQPPIELAAGTSVMVRLDHTLTTSANRSGETFSATLANPVIVGEKTVLPAGTPFQGQVLYAKPSGRLKGRGSLSVSLNSFELNGTRYPISTGSVTRVSGSHKKRNLLWIGGSSGAGALIGGLVGGGKGALIGTGAGAGGGTAGAALTGRKHAVMRAESALRFSLRAPVSLKAKDVKEANRSKKLS